MTDGAVGLGAGIGADTILAAAKGGTPDSTFLRLLARSASVAAPPSGLGLLFARSAFTHREKFKPTLRHTKSCSL